MQRDPQTGAMSPPSGASSSSSSAAQPCDSPFISPFQGRGNTSDLGPAASGRDIFGGSERSQPYAPTLKTLPPSPGSPSDDADPFGVQFASAKPPPGWTGDPDADGPLSTDSESEDGSPFSPFTATALARRRDIIQKMKSGGPPPESGEGTDSWAIPPLQRSGLAPAASSFTRSSSSSSGTAGMQAPKFNRPARSSGRTLAQLERLSIAGAGAPTRAAGPPLPNGVLPQPPSPQT